MSRKTGPFWDPSPTTTCPQSNLHSAARRAFLFGALSLDAVRSTPERTVSVLGSHQHGRPLGQSQPSSGVFFTTCAKLRSVCGNHTGQGVSGGSVRVHRGQGGAHNAGMVTEVSGYHIHRHIQVVTEAGPLVHPSSPENYQVRGEEGVHVP